MPALLASKGGDPGTTGGLGTGTGPRKGELEADCPASARSVVNDLYRTQAPRVVRWTDSDGSGDDPGPREALVPMSRDQAAHYVALKWELTAACPQTTVTAVGFKPIPAETVRFALTKARLGDEAFVQETTTWNGGPTAPSASPDAGERTYTTFVRVGGVLIIYGDFPSKAAAVAGGTKATAHARDVLLKAVGG